MSYAERHRSASPKQARTVSHLIPSLGLDGETKTSTDLHSRSRARSTSPHRDVQVPSSGSFTSQKWQNRPLESSQRMPPPPPKFFSSRQGGNVTFHLNSTDCSRSDSNGDWRQRPRAESLDLRTTHRPDEDTSISFLGEIPEEPTEVVPSTPQRRRRSASCSILTPSRNPGSEPTFDPILEEPVGHALQEILEGDT